MTTPQEAARAALGYALARVESQAPDDASDTEREEWADKADSILTALQADPDAARAVVALLGGESQEVESLSTPAPQDDREAEENVMDEKRAGLREALSRIESLLVVAPEHRDRMQRWEHGTFNDTDNTAALAGTDRTILISQMDHARDAIYELRHSPLRAPQDETDG